MWAKLIDAKYNKNKNLPGKTIVIVNNDPGFQNFWHIGSTGGKNPKPLLQVGCNFMVTNITDHPVGLAQAIWKGSVKGDTFTRQIISKRFEFALVW